MDRRLATVFVQPKLVSEEFVTRAAPNVDLVVVIGVVILVVKMFVAHLAVVAATTLNPVLFESDPGVEVDVTVFTPVMKAQQPKVLVERESGGEISVAAVTPCHCGGNKALIKVRP